MERPLRHAGFTALWLLALSAYSDGIPVTPDLKRLTCEHITIRLEADQVVEVERLREITLTGEQLRPLQAIYPNVARKLQVLSSRWDSCMCGFGVIAIWCRPGEVDIPTYSVEIQKEIDEYEAQNPPPPDEEEVVEARTAEVSGTDVKIDSKCRMFIVGKAVEEIRLFSLINDVAKRHAGAESSVYLDTPPPIDKETDERIRALSDRIKAHCEKCGVEFWAQGFSAEDSGEKAPLPRP